MPYTGGAFGLTISDWYDDRQFDKDIAVSSKAIAAIDSDDMYGAIKEFAKPEVYVAFGRLTAYAEKEGMKK